MRAGHLPHHHRRKKGERILKRKKMKWREIKPKLRTADRLKREVVSPKNNNLPRPLSISLQ
jgi:hypothetical protein